MKKKVRPIAIILSFVLLFVSMLSGCQKKEEKEELRQPILALALIKMEHNWGDFSNVVSRWELSEESKEQGPLIYVVPNGNYTFDRTLYYYKTAWNKRSSRKRMMPEEGKTDSESSCSFFGKRKAITRKNALCLRKIRLETPRRRHPVSYLRSFTGKASGRIKMTKAYFHPSSDSSQVRQAGRVRMTRKVLSYSGLRSKDQDERQILADK